MSRFLSARLHTLAPYTPGEQPQDMQYIKLNTNESPFPPAPGVIAAVNAAEVSRLNLYSDPAARVLEDALAERYGLSPEEVIAGNGSDEILAFAYAAFTDSACGIRFPDISYGFYPVYARLYGIDAQTAPLRDDFSIDPIAHHHAGRTVILANPNAPTGLSLPLTAVEGIVRANRENVVIIDEAYVDFGGESAVPLIHRYPNLLVIQTFSKARQLAGARIGYAMGQRPLIDDLRRVKYAFNPYNLNRLSQLAGAAALADEPYFAQCIAEIVGVREETRAQLVARGFTVTDSRANFLFARAQALSGAAYYRALKARGVLVRHFDLPRIRDYVRITIGSGEQMRALLTKTDDILSQRRAHEAGND